MNRKTNNPQYLEDTNSPTSIGWETYYTDDSGVEFGVYFQADNRTGENTIRFTSIDSVCFPEKQLDWLIDCLKRIKEQRNI